MKSNNRTLINDIVNPVSNSTVVILDLHASESGALAILDDLYEEVSMYEDKSIIWNFIVSTPNYAKTDNINVYRFPWVKKNWIYRYIFDSIFARKLISDINPDKILSLQNSGVSFFNKEQIVYLHLPFILTGHRFSIKVDGLKLWVYQNIVSKNIFKSLKKVDKVIVQTEWMRNALNIKGKVDINKIEIIKPNITVNEIGYYIGNKTNNKMLFYPATAFSYKNHMTILKAMNYIKDLNEIKVEVIFTITGSENKLAKRLYDYAKNNELDIKFLGNMSRTEVFDMYTKSILVFPSYVESFGLPLLEARMTGTPIIASKTSFSEEILESYKKVSYFEEMNYKQLAKIIVDLEEIDVK